MRRLLAPAAIALLPAAMFAHEGHDHGLAPGLIHPVTGADHLLAMVAVGLLAARVGGRGRWLVPLAFLAPMALGGLLGLAGLAVPGIDWGIALSVLVIGALVAVKRAPSAWMAAAVVAPFALCHGIAHGAELPASASGTGYVAGFLVATAVLHAIGLGAGLLASAAGRAGAVRVAGAAVAVASLLLSACLI